MTTVYANAAPAPYIYSSAVISPDQRYRYLLTRQWAGTIDDPRELVVWLMMNPSTADALADDATIRKCCGFAKRWGYSGIRVVNLFALRARQPANLLAGADPNSTVDPIGPAYFTYLQQFILEAPELIVAWGCESTLRKPEAKPLRMHRLDVLENIRLWRPDLKISCLGRSRAGTPYHPLMLGYDTPRSEF